MSNNAHELSNRLLNALDNNYNVVDMQTVNEIISILEKFNITKELLETTRLGKHVNELRRKTSEPTLARRAKVLVKRWRDLVIPAVEPHGRALPGSNRSSSERQVRRLGGTPLTSPALSRQVVSPAVPSPRVQSRPAWGGYESDSQDVILVDDDPAPPPLTAPSPLATSLKPTTPPVKRQPSPQPLYDEKKAKRDKKPKKRRGHSRSGTGTEATSPLPNMGGTTIPASPPPPALPSPAPVPPLPPPHAWRDRNGKERRRNGVRKEKVDPYTAMVNRIPTHGAKKVKTTKELLEEIQSRGARPPASPGSPDVMLIEPDVCPTKVESPLRNGGTSPRPPSPVATPPPPLPPLEDEREYYDCTCEEETAEEDCPAARRLHVHPIHVRALHHAYLPGINGTRAPTFPHQFAVRKLTDPEKPDLFTSVVPLYMYSDYADDHCAKNMSNVPLCPHLPWNDFAPPPPDPPPPPSPPPIRPYPIDEVKEDVVKTEEDSHTSCEEEVEISPEMVSVPNLEPSERLKAPILSIDEETQFHEVVEKMDVEESFETKHEDHRTVERTKEDLNGQALYDLVQQSKDNIPYDYNQMCIAPIVTLPDGEEDATTALEEALQKAEAVTERMEFDRPPRTDNFTEWHECARLGELIALPYVVID